jgi:hypothetical protein
VSEDGTPISYFKSNSGQVTSNFQIFKTRDGGDVGNGCVQMLPFNWQPWCQINGNYHYAAIETAGMPNEPLNDYQVHQIARILAWYHLHMGMRLRVANSPGELGLITHQAGGIAWGGHACPGDVRAAQRAVPILRRTRELLSPDPKHAPGEPYLHRVWPDYMGPDDFFGNVEGGRHSIGGYNERERDDVRAIKARLSELGYHIADLSGGKLGNSAELAIAQWKRDCRRAHLDHPNRLYKNDWHELFTYPNPKENRK